MSHPEYLKALNDFVEDTAVVIATAYLLGRGRLLDTAFTSGFLNKNVITFGLVFGVIASTEVILPEERYPYMADTLGVAFASLAGGPIAGMVAAAVVALVSFVLRPEMALMYVVTAITTAGISSLIGRKAAFAPTVSAAFLCGLASQAIAAVLTHIIDPLALEGRLDHHAAGAIAGVSLGTACTAKAFEEARVRASSERNRAAAEQSRLLAAEAKLGALRARIHPHFLYNALTAIAALCGIDPPAAQAVATDLGQLMRRTLDQGGTNAVPLAQEVEYVRLYLGIEQKRYGDRLSVEWKLAPDCEQVKTPPFALQTLVENAIKHGVGANARPVKVIIEIRHRRRRTGWVTLAVTDDGGGISREAREEFYKHRGDAMHGLALLDGQLRLMFGRSARVRLFGGSNSGKTLAVVSVPMTGSR